MAAGSRIEVRGVEDLIRSLKGFSKEVQEELVWDLEEAVDPARMKATTFMHEMVNVRSPYDMFRVGVAKSSTTVWMAPAWRRGGGSPRPEMAPHIRKRMERAVEDEKERIYGKVDDLLDRAADHHGW